MYMNHTSGVFIFGATILANQFNKVLEVILHWRVFARNVKMEASASSPKKKKARALLTYFSPQNKNQAKAVDPSIAALTSYECSTTTTSNLTSQPVSLPDGKNDTEWLTLIWLNPKTLNENSIWTTWSNRTHPHELRGKEQCKTQAWHTTCLMNVKYELQASM